MWHQNSSQVDSKFNISNSDHKSLGPLGHSQMVCRLFPRSKLQPQWPPILRPSKPPDSKPASGVSECPNPLQRCHSGHKPATAVSQWPQTRYSGVMTASDPLQWGNDCLRPATVVSQWPQPRYSGEYTDPDPYHGYPHYPRRPCTTPLPGYTYHHRVHAGADTVSTTSGTVAVGDTKNGIFRQNCAKRVLWITTVRVQTATRYMLDRTVSTRTSITRTVSNRTVNNPDSR